MLALASGGMYLDSSYKNYGELPRKISGPAFNRHTVSVYSHCVCPPAVYVGHGKAEMDSPALQTSSVTQAYDIHATFKTSWENHFTLHFISQSISSEQRSFQPKLHFINFSNAVQELHEKQTLNCVKNIWYYFVISF